MRQGLARLAARFAPKREASMDWLIVGLGNPGPRYADTRHNVGKRIVAGLAERAGIDLDQAKFDARFGSGRIAGQRVCLATTLKYMNESGRAIAPLASFYKVPPVRVLAVYDEMDLPLGHLRLRAGGGAGGHNGVRSLIRQLGTEDFPRLRVGIGRPPPGWAGADFVLSRFESAEQAELEALLFSALAVLDDLLREGLEVAMNQHNRRAG